MAEVTDKDIEDTLRAAGVGGSVPEHLNVDPADAETLRAAGVDMSRAHQPAPKAPRVEEPPEAGLPPEDRAYVEQGKREMRSTPGGYLAPVAEGVPALGPAIRHTAAGVAAVVPGMGLPGDTYGNRFERNVRAANTMMEEHLAGMPPGYVIPAELAGGALTTGPLAATRLGSLALGMRGPSIGARAYAGSAGGATISALDAISRGENPFFPAVIGGTAGLLGPVVGEAGRVAGRTISEHAWPRPSALKDVNPVNISRLTGALEAETPASIDVARRRMGPTGFASDLNPEMSDLALGLHSGTGAPKATIQEAYRVRHAQQANEMKTVLDKTVGPAMDEMAWEKHTIEHHKTKYTPLYQAWEAAKVQPTDKLKALIPRLEGAGAFAKAEEISKITGEPINTSFFTAGNTKDFPTAKSWQYVKQGLNTRIDEAYRAGQKEIAGALVDLKDELTTELYKTKAGKLLEKADETFSSMKNIQEHEEAGRDTFIGGRSGQTVSQLRKELKGLTKVEQAARIQGLRTQADHEMGMTITSDSTYRNQLLSPNNQEKIKMMLGNKDGEELIDRMKSLKYLGDQKNAVIGGSQTTPRASARDALKPPERQPWGFNATQPQTILPPSLREGMRPGSVMDAWRKQRYGDADNQLAAILTTPEGPQLDLLLKSLRSEAFRRQKASAAADAGGNALSGMLTVPVPTTARRQIER